MSTHDYVIANQTGANTRSDLNNAFSAIVSNNSSATEPTTTYAYQWWADTGNDLLKQRNAADSAWISILTLSTGAVSNAAIADDAVTLAKMAAGTDGELITYDTSGDPTTVPTGSSGQVLTSNGAGTTPTFQTSTHTPDDNSVTLAKMAHGTDGELITYDATGAPANVAVGTSGQVLTSGGTGVAPTFQTAAGGGLYASVAIICDQKSAGTMGGTFTSGAWRTRDLNTEISDADGIVSISSNQFTLAAGTYTIEWFAISHDVDSNVSKLRNTSDSSDVGFGFSHFSEPAYDGYEVAYGTAVTTIASAKTFEIQHYAQTTKSLRGFGKSTGISGVVEKYTIVKILKHS